MKRKIITILCLALLVAVSSYCLGTVIGESMLEKNHTINVDK